MRYDMNVRLRLDDTYNFSISQEIDSDGSSYKHLVEVALFCGDQFVPCNVWATSWVGSGANNDAVIRMVDAYSVADLLQFAKEYVYIKEHEYV